MKEYTIFDDVGGEILARIEVHKNNSHYGNTYIRIKSSDFAGLSSIKRDFFGDIRVSEGGAPLQAMVYSDDPLAGFLIFSGFKRRRSCFEAEVSAGDMRFETGKEFIEKIGILSHEAVFSDSDSELYAECAELLFEHYSKTHADVNPLTASFADFCAKLPQTVYFARSEHALYAAFVEGNEIAYICASSTDGFENFAAAVCSLLFCKFDKIFFEADDIDWAAMSLLSLFEYEDAPTFDTYILD